MLSPIARLLADLEAQGLLPPAQVAAIAEDERIRPFSLHFELRALLYLGVVLLAGGLGVLVYQHLDSIGHEAIIAFVALAMSASFFYAARHRPDFTWGEAPRTSIAADYLLLLGCLLFLVLEGYLQVQYQVFGTRYGLVTLLPAVIFLALAYRYDHRGVLSLAITAVAAWVGVSVAPLAMFKQGSFPDEILEGPGLVLGVALVAAGLASEYLNKKRHFAYTYLALGSNLALLAASALLFDDNSRKLLWLLLVVGLSAGLVWYARRTQSYLFLLLGVAYSYVALTYALITILGPSSEGTWLFLIIVYFPLTLMGIVLFFINIKKMLRLAWS